MGTWYLELGYSGCGKDTGQGLGVGDEASGRVTVRAHVWYMSGQQVSVLGLAALRTKP